MKLSKLILFFLFTSFNIYCQDTVSVFFEFGKSTIQESDYSVLNLISSKFDLSELDSVNFIGVSDSVGNFESNLKLSKKRAVETIRYCASIFPKNYIYKITAIGERSKNHANLNRRVDIVLYFKTDKTDIEEIPEPTATINGCYYIDYKLLHRSHKRVVTREKVDYIIIETRSNDLKKINLHYYLSTAKNGSLIVKKVKWANKTTGKSWWANYRYVTTIPKSDYDKFKIFQLGELPCNDCSEDIKNQKTNSKENACMQLDRFLMENIQVKTKIFNRKTVSIRAPKEYVDITDKYYIGCNYDLPLYWKTHQGKRNKNYYFTQLPIYNLYLKNIVRTMECCNSNPELSECDKALIKCQTLSSVDKSVTLIGELGNHYQFVQHIPYVSMGISKCGNYSQSALLIGTDIKLNLYGSLRCQFNFVSFPFSALNPISSWQSPNNIYEIEKYGRLYIGTELKTRFNNSTPDLFEQNVHLGISYVNSIYRALIPRVFIQYGIGYDYLKNYSIKPYSVFQMGINFRIARLGKRL